MKEADRIQLPEGWVHIKLGNFVEALDNRRKPINAKERALRVEGKSHDELFPYYGATGQVVYIDDYLLESEYILLGEDSTIWRDQIPDCIHQNHVFRARTFKELTLPLYTAYYSQTPSAKDYFFRNAKQTVNLASINMTILSNLSVPLCSTEEQHQIVQEIESRLSVAEHLEKTVEDSLRQAEVLRQSILQRAFSGQLVPQDPNDEPAAELLQRVQAEKSTKPKQKGGTKAKTSGQSADEQLSITF